MATDEQPLARSTLLHKYMIVTRHYAWTVSELSRQRATLPQDEYARMYKMVEYAREDCERLRTAIQDLDKRES